MKVVTKRQYVRYDPKLKELAKRLRKNSTLSEVLLWKELKGKQMMGYDFHRQKPIGCYIIDFYCPELFLAIEIDGESHLMKQEEVRRRQQQLEQLGIRFLRFDDLEVKMQMEKVLNVIREWIEAHQPETKSCTTHSPLACPDPFFDRGEGNRRGVSKA
jgi:very-short-patch-repair endonuclease